MASRRSELEHVTPKYLWEELHIKQGQTAMAASLAREVLDGIDTRHFSDFAVAQRHGEIAAITMMTSMSASKKSADWQTAEPHIIRAANTVLEHYPLGSSEDDAQLRGNYWDPVYGKESAQRIAAGDVAKLYDLLSVLCRNDELFHLASALRTVITEKTISSHEHERFELIRIIEKPTTYYKVLQATYAEFMRRYGFSSAEQSLNQITTITARMLGRAMAEKDMPTVRDCLRYVRTVVQLDSSLWRFVIKEVGKHLVPSLQPGLVDHKLTNWAAAASSSEELLTLIQGLEKLVFVGMGHDQVASLK